jgi:hypothetical protein
VPNNTLLIAAAVLQAVMFSPSGVTPAGPVASAAPATKIYSVCELRANAAPVVRKRITVRGDVGHSFHFGVTLSDARCAGEIVTIRFPAPDPKGIQQKFHYLWDGTASGGEDFTCDCSGRITYSKYNISVLEIDNAVLNSTTVSKN